MAREDTPLRSGRHWILWIGGLGVVLTVILGIWYTIQDGEALEILRKYRTVSLPVTFLIDRRGVIRYKHIGYNDWTGPEARKRLEEVLR